MGTPDFAVPSLENLISSGYAPVAVVTGPDKPRGRGQNLSPTPVKETALRHGIDVLQPEDLGAPGFLAAMEGLFPDLFVVVAFRILPVSLFTIPRLGAFNLHASLLPQYRGAAPINWAIIRGETRTGVTTFQLEERVDRGGILLQAGIPILPDDDAGSVHDKLARLGAEVVVDTVRLFESGEAVPRLQNHALASTAPKIFKEDCRIDWSLTAEQVRNFIRGLSPYPAAFTTLHGKTVKVYRVSVLREQRKGNPGELEPVPKGLRVASGDRMLSLEELQLEGGRRMSADEFVRGHTVQTGDRFE